MNEKSDLFETPSLISKTIDIYFLYCLESSISTGFVVKETDIIYIVAKVEIES